MLPLGIASIAAYVQSAGVNVDTYDLGAFEGDATAVLSTFDRLAGYDVIGLSFYNVNAIRAMELASALRHRNPDQLIVAGGPHPSSCGRQVMSDCPAIDIVVKGEGELPFAALTTAFLDGSRTFPDIPGLLWRTESGAIAENPGVAKVQDLDSLPAPDLSFVAAPETPLTFYDRRENRLRRAVAVTTSRSCPYNCSFCAIILIGRDWRRASVHKVVSDFRELNDRFGSFDHVYFMDANFFVNSRRALEIARALASTEARPTFSFSTRVNQILRAEPELHEMVSLGLRAIELGVESASAAALQRFAKDTTPEQNDRALALVRDLDLQLIFDFIMFDAEASVDDLAENLALLERHGLDAYVPWDHLFSWLTPYHGTPIRERYERELGLALPLHELPEPQSLFKDDLVRRIFREMSALGALMPKIRASTIAADRRVRAGDDVRHDRSRAQSALDAVSVRRLPFRVLRNLVGMAQEGARPELRVSLPTVSSASGEAVTMENYLDALACN